MPKAKSSKPIKLRQACSIELLDEYMAKDTLIQHYANWYHKHVSGDAQASTRARQILLAHALKHKFISDEDEDAFNMLIIKTTILNGFFDTEFNAECIKYSIHYAPYLSARKEIMHNPALARFFFALHEYCDSNCLSFNLLERAHRKITTRTLAYDQSRLAQIASSTQKLKVFVTELNNKDD